MIPKTIHFCWFGKNKKNELNTNCINSWKKHLKGYEFVEWNEDNFDVTHNGFASEAFSRHKYAFVSDYARLMILKRFGGIYLDTDVEVLKDFDPLLENDGFIGFADADPASDKWEFNTACIGACPNNPWIEYLLSYYDDRKFLSDNGSYNTTTNSQIITKMSSDMFEKRDSEQMMGMGNIRIYPRECFDPFHPEEDKMVITDNTFAIHWHDCSWGRPANNLERISGFVQRKMDFFSAKKRIDK